MNENFEKNTDFENEDTEKRGNKAVDVVIKILTVCCVIAAVGLLGVMVMAFMGLGDNSTNVDAVIPPEIIATTTTTTTTTEPTTTAAAPKATVYIKADADVKAAPSNDAETVGSVKFGDTIGLIAMEADGWYRAVYDNRECYIHKNYLSVKKPELNVDEETGRTVIDPEQEAWYLVVVDHDRQMPENYEPELEYIADSDYELDYRVAEYYDEMYYAALEEGIELTPVSAYRYYSTQESNFNALVEEFIETSGLSQEDAEAKAATEILPAGCSEHNLGLAVDIGSVEDDFKYSDAYNWLKEHAHEYGFIERYTEEKQDITGIIPEPWHWRYVGAEHAKVIAESGISLEEYLQQNNIVY